MTYSLQILVFLIILSFMLFNIGIYRYFHNTLQQLQYSKQQVRIFDVMSFVFITLSIILLGTFGLYFIDKYFVLSSVSFLCLIGIISIADYKIYQRNREVNVWWHHRNLFDILFAVLMVIVSIGTFYLHTSSRAVLLLIGINILFMYAFFLKKIIKQHKFVPFFSNRYLNFIIFLFVRLFYYICWGILSVYIVSMGLNDLYLVLDPYDIDSCLDTGVCKEGTLFDDCGNGLPCRISKEKCIQDNNIWLEDSRSCDTRHLQSP